MSKVIAVDSATNICSLQYNQALYSTNPTESLAFTHTRANCTSCYCNQTKTVYFSISCGRNKFKDKVGKSIKAGKLRCW